MKRIITLILLIILFAAQAQSQEWQTIKFPYMENITGIDFVNDDTGFVCTIGGNIGRTVDGGKEWKINSKLKNVMLEDIFVIDVNNIITVGRAGAAYKTTTGGTSWQNMPLGDSTTLLMDIEMFDKDTGLVIGNTIKQLGLRIGIIWRTVNGGTSWEKVDLSGMGFTEIFSQKDKTLYFLSYNNVHISIDKGYSWRSIDLDITEPPLSISMNKNSGIICGSGGISLYTEDYGKTWTKVKLPVEDHLITVQLIDNKTGYIGGMNSILFKTTDGGKSWTYEKLPIEMNIFDFYLTPTKLYAVGDQGKIIVKKIK